MSPNIVVRSATSKDVEGILLAHFSAIQAIAAFDYPADVISKWSAPVTKERIENYVARVLPNETTVVAEIKGQIVGFGSIVESKNELRAVYVHSDVKRSGVGAALLRELESLAVKFGCAELHMASSLTAEMFYRKNGFEIVSRGTLKLSASTTMACVYMRKQFSKDVLG